VDKELISNMGRKMKVDFTKRSREDTARLAARYWGGFIRKHVSGFEVVDGAKLENPMGEAFCGFVVESMIRRIADDLTPEFADRFEHELASVILNGADVEAHDGGTFHLCGIS